MALTTALEGGFFDKHGVNVTFMPMSDGVETSPAVRQGHVDVAVSPVLQVVMSLSSPRPLVAIGRVTGSTNLNVVVAGGIARDRGLSPDSPLPDRLSGLEGLRIGHPPGPQGVNVASAVLEIYLAAVPASPVITQMGYDNALTAFGLDAVPFEAIVDNSFAEAAATR